MLPSFIGIGAQRCGTTWLYECLAAHPDVYVSSPKELYFFTKNYSLGIEWYKNHFSSKGDARAWGEITPGYFYRPEALERMAKNVPDARLFVILRNPIDRALSAFKFFYNDHYRGLSFQEAIQQDSSILEQGMYSQALDRLFGLYRRDRCLVLFYDDIVDSPGRLVEELYEHVGVYSGYRPDMLTRRVNQAIFPRTQTLLTAMGMRRLIDGVKHSRLGDGIQSWHSRRGQRSREGADPNRKFLRNYYAEEIDRLQSVFDRDLSNWKG